MVYCLTEPPTPEEEECYIQLILNNSNFEQWIDAMNVDIVEDDWVDIPVFYRLIHVPSAMLINPSDGNCVIAPSSSLTNPALKKPTGRLMSGLAKRKAWNKKRNCRKKEEEKAERLKKRVNDGIPISRGKFGKVEGLGSLFSGGRRTCQPDTVAMLLADFGIAETQENIREALMPDWKKKDSKAPGMDVVRDFYIMKGLNVVTRGDLSSNELAILQQWSGVFHLCAELTVLNEDGTETISKHACVYNASSTVPGKVGRGVLRDNQRKVQPLLIEDSDRVDKFAARKAFLQLWDCCSKAKIMTVYEIKK